MAEKQTVKSARKAQGKVTSRPEVQLPSLDDLLQAGSHFGHRTSRWDPKMDKYIYTNRNGVHIIDLVQTMKLLKDAVEAIQNAAEQKSVIIVGTKGQAASMVKEAAEEVGAFYVDRRWPGGLLTNFDVVKKSVQRLVRQEEEVAKGLPGLVKKERMMAQREVERLNRMYEGVKFMDRAPGLIIVIDSKVEDITIREAHNAGIPVVALLDTNCDPTGIDYPVPANDDSIKSIELFVGVFREALRGAKRADAIKALRNGHIANLVKLKAEYDAEIERKTKMAEDEADRMRRLRSGEVVADAGGVSTVVRVVKKAADSNPVKAKKVEPKKEVKAKPAPKKEKKPVKKVAKKPTSKKTEDIASLNLGTRIENALTDAKVKDVAALVAMSDDELAALKGIGASAVEKIRKAVK